MSAYAQIRIDPPEDWTVFERGAETLWMEILDSGTVKRYGRGGQEQFGLDLVGFRNGDRLVGVQLKAKGPRERMKVSELRTDFSKAIAHHPELAEYYFASTAPNDVAMDDAALAIVAEQAARGHRIAVAVWGWGTLQSRIQEHPKAMAAFDASHGPHAAETIQRLEGIARGQEDIVREVSAIAAQGSDLAELSRKIDSLHAALSLNLTDRTEGQASAVERYFDEEIDRYRDEELNGGRPVTARRHLESLWDRLPGESSGRIRFRVRALIGHCHLRMGDDAAGAAEFMASAELAPDEPMARSNRVLALMLRGRHAEAIDAARTFLDMDPTDATTAGYLYQAAASAGIGDPMSNIPAGLRDSDEVRRNALVHDRASGGTLWRTMARAGLAEAPDEEFYRQMAAEADLSDAVDEIEGGRPLDPSLHASLVAAADTLEALWREADRGEDRSSDNSLSLCHNAAAAFVALGETGRAADLVREGLAAGDGNHALNLKAAGLACETGDADWAANVFPKLRDSGHELMAKVQLASMLGKWDYLASGVGSKSLDTVAEEERSCVEVMVEFARARLAPPSEAEAAALVGGLAGKFAGDCKALALVSRLATHLGLADPAEAAFEEALASLGTEATPSQYNMVSALAEDRGDNLAVIEALAARPAILREGDAVLRLAKAYAYVRPARVDAAAFFDSLPATVRNGPRYVRLEAIAHFNGGLLDMAEERCRLLLELDPHRVGPVLLLVQTLMRRGRRAEIDEVAGKLVPEEMTGGPVERMRFAQLLAMTGRTSEALAFGLATLEANRDNPEVHVFWVGLAFSADRELLTAGSDVAAPGTWVRLESDTGDAHAFIIADGPEQHGEGYASPDNPFVANVLGNAVGHRFEMVGAMEIPVEWRIEEIRSRYLHAFREVSDRFNKTFPDSGGFWKLTMREGDVSPLMKGLKKDGERRDRLLEMHRDGSMPIRSMASSPGGTVAFANTLAMSGRDVRGCVGAAAERKAAAGAIRRFRAKGVVVDTLALWTLLEMGAVADVLAVFPRIVVPQSTMDELFLMRDELVMEARRPSRRVGTASFLGGRYLFEPRTEEGRSGTLRWLDRAIETVRSSCEVAPARVDGSLGRHEHRCLAILGDDALDAGIVARERDLLHLTQDLSAREFARMLLGVDGCWLQVVFMEALELQLITLERYAHLVTGLAARRHGHVSLDPATLVAAARLEGAEVEHPVAAVARYLGDPTAHIRSHLAVALIALRALWSGDPSNLAVWRATGAMLDNLVARRREDWHEVLEIVERASADIPGLGRYVEGWKGGHFLSREDDVPEDGEAGGAA